MAQEHFRSNGTLFQRVTEGYFVVCCPFCALVRRIMIRKEWSVEDDLPKALWKQILMSPRPPSTRWPPAQRGPAPKGRPQQKKETSRSSPSVQLPKKGPTTVEKLTRALSALDGLSPEAQVLRESLEKAKAEAISREPTRASPDEVRSAALAKIARLEAAITALGPDDSKEKSVLEEALQKVKKGAKMTPVGERLDFCLQFIERASKRLQLCEVDLAQVLQKKSRLEDELVQARRNLTGFVSRGIRDSSRTSSASACRRRSGATPSGGCKVEDGEGRFKEFEDDNRGRQIASGAPRSSEGERLF